MLTNYLGGVLYHAVTLSCGSDTVADPVMVWIIIQILVCLECRDRWASVWVCPVLLQCCSLHKCHVRSWCPSFCTSSTSSCTSKSLWSCCCCSFNRWGHAARICPMVRGSTVVAVRLSSAVCLRGVSSGSPCNGTYITWASASTSIGSQASRCVASTGPLSLSTPSLASLASSLDECYSSVVGAGSEGHACLSILVVP